MVKNSAKKEAKKEGQDKTSAEVYLDPCQTSEMFFAKLVNGWKLSITF